MNKQEYLQPPKKQQIIMKTTLYPTKRTTYKIHSIFIDKVSLTDALYEIAMMNIKTA